DEISAAARTGWSPYDNRETAMNALFLALDMVDVLGPASALASRGGRELLRIGRMGTHAAVGDEVFERAIRESSENISNRFGGDALGRLSTEQIHAEASRSLVREFMQESLGFG